ncbi:MAG: epoxyqueuosine reductase QueH [Tissierellia bacterium]|nr:epoxyqueuosine reductase QueH [Tissierellia bacterium]
MQKINYNLKMKDIIKENEKNNIKPTLLLQVCCGPCSSEVLTRLRDYFDIDIYYYNPNIYPIEEFKERSKVVENLIKDMNLKSKVIVPENNPKDFYDYVDTRKDDHEMGKSCYKCYELRLRKTAIYAKERGYDFFSTTLSISPYKKSDWLNEIGAKLEKEYGIRYLYSDFKKENGYKNSIELSKKYNLYRQDYCGCVYSYNERRQSENKKIEKD